MCYTAFRRVLLLAVAFVPACATVSRDDLPPCVLLTHAEAEIIAGTPMRLSEDGRGEPGFGCGYVSGAYPSSYSVSLQLQHIPSGQAVSHDSAHRGIAATYGSVEDVPGVGDVAFLAITPPPDNGPDRRFTLYVRSNDVAFQIYASSSFAPHETPPRLISQAKLVLSRLDKAAPQSVRGPPN